MYVLLGIATKQIEIVSVCDDIDENVYKANRDGCSTKTAGVAERLANPKEHIAKSEKLNAHCTCKKQKQ